MKWRWFWIAVAVFLGSLRVYKVDRWVNIDPNVLTKMCVIFMILSGAFILYFILDKTGAIDYLNEKLNI